MCDSRIPENKPNFHKFLSYSILFIPIESGYIKAGSVEPHIYVIARVISGQWAGPWLPVPQKRACRKSALVPRPTISYLQSYIFFFFHFNSAAKPGQIRLILDFETSSTFERPRSTFLKFFQEKVHPGLVIYL